MRFAKAVVLLVAMLSSACEEPGPTDGSGQQLVQIDGPDVLTSEDLCQGIADPCSDEGAHECVQGGLRECVEVGGCLQWGFRQACAAGTACQDGICVAACAGQECTIVGARKCGATDSSEVLICDDRDGDGCLAWGVALLCDGGQICASGGLCGTTCKDECAEGFVKCEGHAVVTCGEYDGDGCTEWGNPHSCPTACAAGRCVGICEDECGSPGLHTCDGIGFKQCQLGGDGCLRWGTVRACAPGSSCSAGECATTCTHECSARGAVACEAGGVKTCDDAWDDDACREWSPPAPCADGTSCSDGVCAAGCDDECTTAGAAGCDPSGLGVRQCGGHDSDPCLEWALVEQCDIGAGETCSLGTCALSCVDECDDGASRCRPGSETRVEVCQNGDPDPCLEWVDQQDCAQQGKVCDDGACAGSCQDDCQQAGCEGGAVAVPCGDFDGDSCLDWGTPLPCQAWEGCEAGVCVAQSAPAAMKISEILYNSPGADTDVFIELHGPAGASLAGYSLVGLNGTGGDVYAVIALGGQLDASGWYVVAHPGAAPWIADIADLSSTAADLQNGPDSLQLRYGPEVVDALGYGSFGPSEHFAGEGAPVAGVEIGHSLTRDSQNRDTGDNAADFSDSAAPNPGGPLAMAVQPSGWGQVLVTEIMADPTVVSDPNGEWIELHNPSATTSYGLAGCVLGDEDSDSHTITTALELAPGAYVTLSRSASPGFEPDYVYGGVVLANGEDEVVLSCGGVQIDAIAWETTMPVGRTLGLDPGAIDQGTSGPDDWCAGTSSYNGDRGTPGTANPPCPITGSFDQTVADSPTGICNLQSNWNEFVFAGVQAPATDGALRFEWLVAWCQNFGGAAQIWVEVQTGTTWTEVGHASASGDAESCAWLFESTTVPQATLATARDTSGDIHGRFRIASGCAAGIECGALNQPIPTNCARNIRLSYEH